MLTQKRKGASENEVGSKNIGTAANMIWYKVSETRWNKRTHAHDYMQLQKWQLALSTWIPVHVVMSRRSPPGFTFRSMFSNDTSCIATPGSRLPLRIPIALGPQMCSRTNAIGHATYACKEIHPLWHVSSYNLIPTYTHEIPASIMKICEAHGRLHSSIWWRTQGFKGCKSEPWLWRGPAKVILQRLWEINQVWCSSIFLSNVFHLDLSISFYHCRHL